METPTRKRGRGRRNDIPWAEIQAAYETGETNVSELARKFGVKRDSIAAHIKKGNWVSNGQAKGQAVEAARAKVIDIATRKAIDQLGGEQQIADEVADALRADLEAHPKIAKLLMDASEQTLEQYIKGGITPGEKQSVADVFNSTVQGVAKALSISRDINGLRPGQSSTEGEQKTKLDKLTIEIVDAQKTA